MLNYIHNFFKDLIIEPTKYEINAIKNKYNNIVFCGMGGSAISAELFCSLHDNYPLHIIRGYTIPSYLLNKHTLFILISHSGITEEVVTISKVLSQHKDIDKLVLSGNNTNTNVLIKCTNNIITYAHDGQPRAAFSKVFGLIVKLFNDKNFFNIPYIDINSTCDKLDLQNIENKSKLIAKKIHNKSIIIVTSDYLATVARRLKCQLNENSKTVANFDIVPEFNHNSLEGISFPNFYSTTQYIFLYSKSLHLQNIKRLELTQNIVSAKAHTIQINAINTTKLNSALELIYYSDLISYYLAMCNNIDPTPVDVISSFKKQLANL